MNQFTEFDIEHYVRFPEEWDSESSQKMKEYLDEHSDAKALALYYRELYKELNRIKRPLMLTLLKPENTVKSTYPQVLAADTIISKSDSIETKATFISGDLETVVRILFDKTLQRHEVYVISSLLTEKEYLLIRLEQCGLEIMVNESGLLTSKYEREFKNVEWQNERVQLHFPVENLMLNEKSKSELIDSEVATLRLQQHHIQMKLKNKKVNRVLMVQNDTRLLHYFESDVLNLPVELDGEIQLYFFT